MSLILCFHLHCSFPDGVTQTLCSYLPKMSALELLRSVYYLSVLGFFPSDPLQQLMTEDTMNQIKTTGGCPQWWNSPQMLFTCTNAMCLPLL